jgi:tetratricopeptide (TPR) repeat protein
VLRYGLAFALAIGVPAGVAAQSAACNTPACTRQNQLWAPAAQIHDIKNQFVATIRQFVEALAGAYGDEGPRISAALASTERALTQWDDAIRVYETALSGMTEDAELHVALGTVYLDRHRIDDALRELGAAGRLDPRRADVPGLMALAYGAADKHAEAAAALRTASALDDGDPLTVYRQGQHLIASGQGEAASQAMRAFQESEWKRAKARRTTGPVAPFERVGLLRQVAAAAPIFPLHPYRQGFALLLAGNYAPALAQFTRAALADPLAASAAGSGTPVMDVFRMAASLRRGELQSTIGELEAAAAGAPERSEVHRILGVAYWADGQFEKSAAQFSDAIGLAPLDERSRIGLANVLAEAGRMAEAEQALAAAIQAIPDSGQAHYRLGQLYQTRSLLPEAVREFEAAASLDPLVGLDSLYLTIGGLHANQANFDRAVAAYVKRIDVNPNNADAHKALGDIYSLQGRHDEALAEFAVALLIDPRNSGALAGAGQVYLRLGRFEEALDASKQALALDARLKDARYALAMSLLRLGRAEEGRRELDVFQRMQAEVMANTQRQSELNAVLRNAARSLESGEFAAAAAQLRKALTFDANLPGVNRDLGLALTRAGQFEQAIPVLEKAAQLSDSAGTRELLATAYNAVGKTADAQAQSALAAQLTERAKAERLQKMSGAR